MDADVVKDSFHRVTKKRKLSASKSQETVDQLIQQVGNAIDLVRSSDPDSCKTVLGQLKRKLQEISPLNQLEETQKDLNIALTKYLKHLEKSFNPDISNPYNNIQLDVHTLNNIIATHFYRQGLFEVGDYFVSETVQCESDLDNNRSHFSEMYRILEAMKNRDLEPAIKWVLANSDKIEKMGSELLMKLHCLQFIDILQSGNETEALNYAKTKLATFATDNMSEIQKYINCLCWAGKLESSPYTHLLSTDNWDSAAEDITKQFCNILGQPYKNPLSLTILAGSRGLPRILKFMTVVMTSRKQEWQAIKQLPLPVELDEEFQFHSIFVCPVSKEQATVENPPMLMACGHALCKQTLNRISKNGTRTFKCPYCPSEISATRCLQMLL
ncbi:hypothetical protein ACFE04_023572 [Oxalis oulophora]